MQDQIEDEDLQMYQTPQEGINNCRKCGDGAIISMSRRGNLFFMTCLGCGSRSGLEDNQFLAMISWNDDQTWKNWRY